MSANPVVAVEPLSFPFKTPDPFLFCVYHVDNYPAGDEQMQAPKLGNGADFNPNAPYRMYHGQRVPGFPQHPHRGFETLTATVTGIIDHADSMGSGGRYGHGDLQWMTAGRGVCHGEMFPLVNTNAPNPLRLFQIWLNLPAKSKKTDPAYVMHWAEEIPVVSSEDGLSRVTVCAGNILGAQGLPPPPNSWAADPASEVAVLHLNIEPGGSITIPAALSGDAINRCAYFIEGKSVIVGDRTVTSKSMITLKAEDEVTFSNPDSAKKAEVLILQGRPINEPVAQQGPFVMNTAAELREAMRDYQRGEFGSWPWGRDDMVFPRDKPRFSLQGGVETFPPDGNGTCSTSQV